MMDCNIYYGFYDGSVVTYYSTGTCRPYKTLDKLPKTVKTWLDENGTQRVVVRATEEAVVIETVTQEPEDQATEVTEPIADTEPIAEAKATETVSEPLKPLKRWIIPTLPYLIAYGAVKAMIGIVAILAIIAGATEATGAIIHKVMRETIKPTARKATKATMQYMQDTWKELKAWCIASNQFRNELIDEWKEPDWI